MAQLVPAEPNGQEANKKEILIPTDKLTRLLRQIHYRQVPCSFIPNYIVRELVLDIENQNTFSGFIYDELCVLENQEESLLLSRDEFIRVWKSCILQRALDLKFRRTRKPSPSYLYFEKPTTVPTPLVHLLEALGRVHCPYTGVTLDMVPPELDEKNLPQWAIYDELLNQKWAKFMISKAYHPNPNYDYLHISSPPGPAYEQFPGMDDYEGKTIGLTAKKIIHGKMVVRSLSKFVKESDPIIRACNDELFVTPVCAFEDMCMECPNKYEVDKLRKVYFHYHYQQT